VTTTAHKGILRKVAGRPVLILGNGPSAARTTTGPDVCVVRMNRGADRKPTDIWVNNLGSIGAGYPKPRGEPGIMRLKVTESLGKEGYRCGGSGSIGFARL
jgi:hypothetical protein